VRGEARARGRRTKRTVAALKNIVTVEFVKQISNECKEYMEVKVRK